MAVKIPLNKFRSKFYNITPTLSAIYTAPDERASIIIQAQATNTTTTDKTVSMYVSSAGNLYSVVEDLPIPAKDARGLVTGRLVLQGFDGGSILTSDVLLIESSAVGVTLSLGILETVNRD